GMVATLKVDGSEFRPFFNGDLPPRPPLGGGVNYLLFADGKRIAMGDYVLECTKVFEECDDATAIPVKYPNPFNTGPLISTHASENIIAPDQKTARWTAILSDYSAVVLTGTLERRADHVYARL